MADLDRAISMAVKTGKVLFGANTVLNSAMTGKAKLIIVASNCPKATRENLDYYCKLSGISLLSYPKTSLELGRICGKPFSISVLAIRDAGDSDILTMAEEENV
ncbi:MAG: 50S ribosomal protein L30e [Candidatus Bathyarchaeia archaeon]